RQSGLSMSLKLLMAVTIFVTASKRAAEHHKKALEHPTQPATWGSSQTSRRRTTRKGGPRAHTATARGLHARHHSEEAAKAHGEEHGKNKILISLIRLKFFIGCAFVIARALLPSRTARGRTDPLRRPSCPRGGP